MFKKKSAHEDEQQVQEPDAAPPPELPPVEAPAEPVELHVRPAPPLSGLRLLKPLQPVSESAPGFTPEECKGGKACFAVKDGWTLVLDQRTVVLMHRESGSFYVVPLDSVRHFEHVAEPAPQPATEATA